MNNEITSGNVIGNCPKCGADMYSSLRFFYCSNKGCSFRIPRQIRQKILSEKTVKQLLEKGKTDVLPGFHKKGYSQTFKALLRITDDYGIKIELPAKTGLLCPKCKKMLTSFDRGFKCINEDICGFILWNQFSGKRLTKDEMTTILTEKRSGLIKDFISKKNGKKFHAYIVMSDSGQLGHEFEKDEENLQ